MPFTSIWHELHHRIDELSDGVLMVTPLPYRRSQIANTQEQRVIISFEDGYRPLQREQFESLGMVSGSPDQ